MIKRLSIWTIALLTAQTLCGQSEVFTRYATINDQKRDGLGFRLAFWNVENLFDLENDSLKNDDAFTPEGDNRYTFGRYKKKSNGIGQTILALGGYEPPELVGLCEVESRWVMDGLTKFGPLKNVGYEIIHQDSPDWRGIDVACIYRPEKFNLILYKYYQIVFPFAPERATRDVLYVKGILPNKDTLHVFFNHWPSRYGGQFASEQGRQFVADLVREKVDSLNQRFHEPLVVITGDFNDEPDDISLLEHLKAKLYLTEAEPSDLVNLSFPIKYKYGTHSFAGEWGVLDQMIVSHSLLQGGSTYTLPGNVGIFDAPWLLKKNAAGNDVPNRTYQGPAYQGGYSDHLPLFLDIILKPKKTGPGDSGAG